MKKYALVLILFLTILNLTGNYLQNEWLIDISKPLLMPSIAFYFIIKWQGTKDVIFIFTLLALFFSWIGDILLMYQSKDENFFLYGLVAFLIAHITYIFDYTYLHTDIDKKQNKVFVISRIVLFSAVGGILMHILWPKLGDFKIPVLIYTSIIILMLVFAILRRDRTNPSSFAFIYGGAILFILSDGMIAVSKFLHPFEYSRGLIMLTYIFAQFFIIKGVIEHHRFVMNK